MKKTNYLFLTFFTITFLLFSGFNPLKAQQLSFPGAEGFGAYATGGRGGTVVHVTNLNESGPGSFADAVSQPNRTVVFDVGGVINISPSNIISISSNITVAGQTAPGGGITIYGNRVLTNGSNIILRFLRIRGSIRMSDGKCSVTCDGASNVIYDHCSISWGRWDNVHITGSNNITFQYCIIGEGIDPQRFGAITDGTRNWTVSHCLWINNTSRNPKMKCWLQYINNVIYNYGNGIVGGHSSADNYQDVINNYFIAGPSASGANYLSDWTATDHLYSNGNYIDLNRDGVLNGDLMTAYNSATIQQSPYLTSPVPVTTESAANAYKSVLNDAGASRVRDSVDTRLMIQLSSLGTKGAIIHSEAEVNGNGIVANGTPPLDTDQDGMPDSWELSKGLNPNLASDGNDDMNNDGYTNLEDYLNYLGNTSNLFRTPNLTAKTVSKTEIDLTWSLASNLHTGFILEKSLNNIDWTQIADVAPTVLSYKDLGLIQNTNYYYRIKAYDSTQSSDYSSVYAKTQSDSPINLLPANKSINLIASKVNFKWDASSEVTSSDFYLGTDPLSLTKVATGLTAKTYTADSLQEKTTYYWRVDGLTLGGTFSSEVWSFTTKKTFPAGMVAWYKLDDATNLDVADSSIYRNNGYLIDMDSTAWQPGLFNGSLNTAGGDLSSHIEIPHSDPLFVDTGVLDISFWMKCASQNAVLFEKLGTDMFGVTKGYTVDLTPTTLKITLKNGTTSLVSSATLPADFFNRWNHIVISRDADINRVRVFINSATYSSVTTTSSMDIGNTSSIFIANNSDLTKPYRGQLDDIRFFNLSFYSNNMVKILYNAYPAPDRAINLLPLNQDSCTDITRIPISWKAGPNSFNPTYDVYLGTDPGNLQLKLANLTTTNAVIPGTLNYNTQYYWRIDSKNDKGASTGEVWSFNTKKLYPNGLVGNWKLDETAGLIAADSSIYRNNGTINLLTGSPIHEAGHLSNGMNFSNGRDSSNIAISNSNPLYFDNNAFSISLWMKQAIAQTASSYLINKGSFASNAALGTNGKWYGIEIKGGNFTFAVDDNVIKTALGTTSAEFCSGQWVHVVAVRDTIAKKLMLYRNGVLIKSIADATGSISNHEKLCLANDRDLNAPYLGSIDEVKLYNYAITPAEIAVLYNEDPHISKTTNPFPATNSLTAISDTATISWTGDANARWYNVYFGTDSTHLTLKTSQISTNKYFINQLSPDSTYYWRIESGNNTYKVQGDIWNFKTIQTQTIRFTLPAEINYSDQPFELVANGGSSVNPVTFAIVSGDAVTLSGNTLTILKTGSVQIKASQAGDVNHIAAADVIQTLIIVKAPQTITFTVPTDKNKHDDDFKLIATGGASGNPVTFTIVSGDAVTLCGNTVHIRKEGTSIISASQPGNDNFTAAVPVEQTLVISDKKKPKETKPDDKDKIGMLIYPNPTDGRVTLKFTKPVKEATLVVVNLCGVKVYEKNVINTSSVEIDLTSRAPGLYFLKVVSDKDVRIFIIIKK